MFSFYKTCRKVHFNKRSYTVKNFTLKDKNQSDGYLIKFSKVKGHANDLHLIKEQLKEVIQIHSDSMFIITMPTIQLCNQYGRFPYPGHNFVFISDKVENQRKPLNEVNILACMSKRPDTSQIISTRKRARDERFISSYEPMVRIYNTRFTSYEEEINIWEKKAVSVSEYPLFVHIIPLKDELNIDANTFKDNYEKIITTHLSYSLHSTNHPSGDHLIPAANCNGAVYEAIFGSHNILVQNMYCQEAVMTMVKPFVNDWNVYENAARELGLTTGIESSLIAEDNYRPAFTC